MFVIYTSKFIPKRFDAINLFLLILIRPDLRHDEGLLEHEKAHTWQIWRYLVLWPILYHCSKKWRLKFEAEAYAVQMDYGLSMHRASYYLQRNYNLDITIEEAEIAIRAAIRRESL